MPMTHLAELAPKPAPVVDASDVQFAGLGSSRTVLELEDSSMWRSGDSIAVIDFELGLDVIVYLFTVLRDFVCWSILDVVDSRMSVNVGHMYN